MGGGGLSTWPDFNLNVFTNDAVTQGRDSHFVSEELKLYHNSMDCRLYQWSATTGPRHRSACVFRINALSLKHFYNVRRNFGMFL